MATKLRLIGEAAQVVGIAPATLRDYERRGLLIPARDDFGNRRYSDADIEQAREILQRHLLSRISGLKRRTGE